MTPGKRATLMKVYLTLLATALLVYGVITENIWLAVLLGH